MVGETALAFDDVVLEAYMARVPLSATGFYATPKISWDKAEAKGRPFFYFAYGGAVSEAVIDTLTGENRHAALRHPGMTSASRSIQPLILARSKAAMCRGLDGLRPRNWCGMIAGG